MEDLHPIPQNVTSFQFKLVGDMTLKQFGYLAAGSVTAYLIFVFLAHDFPLISWPLIIISALLGVAFAFLPIGSRPLDHWTKAFLKAIYSPTKRVWAKNNTTFKENSLFGSRLVMYLSGLQPQQPPQAIGYPPPTAVTPNIVSTLNDNRETKNAEQLPTQEELGKTVDLARQAQQLQVRIIQTERALSQIKTAAQKPTPIPVDYSQQVNKILADLQDLVGQASSVKQQIQTVQQPSKPAAVSSLAARVKVKVVVSNKLKQTQIALTTFPNVVNGIIKDQTGNLMEGVVAVLYDREGLPVRALKTNKLGQFSGSTPLPNSTYTLELEKDNFTFDVLQIELTGEVLPPLMITAKG